jgi:hypothetical protein
MPAVTPALVGPHGVRLLPLLTVVNVVTCAVVNVCSPGDS